MVSDPLKEGPAAYENTSPMKLEGVNTKNNLHSIGDDAFGRRLFGFWGLASQNAHQALDALFIRCDE